MLQLVLVLTCVAILAMMLSSQHNDTDVVLMSDGPTSSRPYSAVKKHHRTETMTPGGIMGKYIPTAMGRGLKRRFIVYDCSKARPGKCGGWSDRLSGILTVFVISIITKQQFLIHHDNPCQLEDYLVPRLLDWRFNPNILVNRTSTYHDLKNHKSDRIREYLDGSQNLSSYFTHDVNFVRINWDYTDTFRMRTNIGEEVPWIRSLHYADIYKEVFNFLFIPSEFVSAELEYQIRTQKRTACAHIRYGGNPNMPDDLRRERQPLSVLWKFMDKLDKDIYDIFISADSDDVRKIAKNRYRDNIIDTWGKIAHIDRPRAATPVDPRESFLKQLLDFLALTRCDILIIQSSGFGINAAYLRNHDLALYCWENRAIVPCTRHTLPGKYHTQILAPRSQQ